MKDASVTAGGKKSNVRGLVYNSKNKPKKDILPMTKGRLQGAKKNLSAAKDPLASKPADWKKKNFNLSINVPASAIQKLRDGKTKSNNIKTYKGTKSAVMKEAMNRFYGKGWEGSAAKGSGKMKDAPVGPKSVKPKNTAPKGKLPVGKRPKPSFTPGSAYIWDDATGKYKKTK